MPFVRQGRDKIAGLIVGADTKVYGSTGAVLWLSCDNATHNPASSWFALACAAPTTMEAGFPLRAANILQFQGKYTTAMANGEWNSWGIADATATAGAILLNFAAQQALGTKTCAAIWTLTACFTITTALLVALCGPALLRLMTGLYTFAGAGV